MSKKLMEEETVQALKSSPYIESASERSVTFTPEFKKVMYAELKEGKNIRAVLEERGIDTVALGQARMNGIADRLRKEAEREEGFANLRKRRRTRRSNSIKEKEESLEKQVRHLKAELAYMRQEVEFLKKVQQADTEARISWESKRRPK